MTPEQIKFDEVYLKFRMELCKQIDIALEKHPEKKEEFMKLGDLDLDDVKCLVRLSIFFKED